MNQFSRKNELLGCWVITGLAVCLLGVYLAVALMWGATFQTEYSLQEGDRILVRTVCYALAIIGFPMTNLIRHMQLRLNQTMPGVRTAQQRYQTTIIVSMTLVQSNALLGVMLYCLGDGRNSLSILLGMSGLAIYLYRPKYPEYQAIKVALEAE